MSIIWAVNDARDMAHDLSQATMLAVACSIELHKVCFVYFDFLFCHSAHQALDNYKATEHDFLRLHMGIGCGLLTCIHVVRLVASTYPFF